MRRNVDRATFFGLATLLMITLGLVWFEHQIPEPTKPLVRKIKIDPAFPWGDTLIKEFTHPPSLADDRELAALLLIDPFDARAVIGKSTFDRGNRP